MNPTSVSLCGSTMLLVPLSKMTVRVVFRVGVDCLLTIIEDDDKAQLELRDTDAYVKFPA